VAAKLQKTPRPLPLHQCDVAAGYNVESETRNNQEIHHSFGYQILNKKQTPWPLVRKRTIPTELPPLVDRGVSRGQRGGSPTVVDLSFLDRSRYFSFK
jgi:hypothetical protein